MSMKVEQLIERLIAEGKLKREELDELIEKEREQSPVHRQSVDIESIGTIEGIQMQMIDSLGQMVGQLSVELEQLKTKVNGGA